MHTSCRGQVDRPWQDLDGELAWSDRGGCWRTRVVAAAMAAVRTASPPGRVSYCSCLRQRAAGRAIITAISRRTRNPTTPSCRREMLFFRHRLLLLLLLTPRHRIWYPGLIRDLVTPSDRTRPQWPTDRRRCLERAQTARWLALIPSTG